MRQETRWVRQIRLALVGVLVAGLFVVLPFAATPVGAVSTTLVISQVYGGGSNSGAPYRNDFIEIFNLGTAPIDLSAYTVQYFAATGGSGGTAQTLSGMLAPGRYYLIQEAGGTTNGVALPTPDLTPGSPFNMSGTNGRVDLATGGTLVDRVGYGTANLSEGTPTAALSNTTAAIRNGSGCTDTDNNSVNFTVTTPSPRNTSTAANPCGGTTTPSISLMPTTGPAAGGTSVTITGTNTNFVAGTTTVTFGGVMATMVTVNSPTSLTAVAPPAANMAANSTVSVTVTTGTETATAATMFAYTVASAPTVTGITPAMGPTTGGTAVTITGTNFVNTGTTTVAFTIGGMTANVTGTVVDAMTITATTPASPGGAGAATVTVTNNGVAASGSTTFTYTAAGPTPTITNIRPAYGPTTGGTTVTITGTNFAADSTVSFGGTPGTVVATPTATSITVTTPAGAAGATNVVITNPTVGTSVTATNGFAYVAAAQRIHDIQGASHRSPLEGTTVTGVPGIVTAKTSSGFYLQEDPAFYDANVSTSEAIFVFGSASASAVAVGNIVTVNGTVQEFRPGGTGGANNLRITEIGSPVVTVRVASSTLPEPTLIGNGGRQIPAQYAAPGDYETPPATFDPAMYALDFFESLEAMRVQVNDAKVVGPRANTFGEFVVVPDNGAALASKQTARGGVFITAPQDNPQRIFFDDTLTNLSTTVPATVGDRIAGATVGIIDYSFGNYKFNITSLGTYVSGNLMRETTALVGDANRLTVGNLNVENLAPGQTAKADTLAGYVKNNLQSPDIIVVEEIQDNNGATNDSVVAADVTYNQLIAAITTAGGPTYQFRQIDPVDDQDGGEPGGNIRVGFLFNPNRVTFVDRPGGTSTAANSVVTDSSGTHLLYSPGRINPTNPAFNSSRKPLVGEFVFNGTRFFAIANHFNSKGGDTPLYGRYQPIQRPSEVQRQQQALIVHDFVQSLLTADASAKVVIAGDLNDFQFSDTLKVLRFGTATPAPGATPIIEDLVERLPLNEQYTYVFEGNSQVLDHILVSTTLSGAVAGTGATTDYDVVHINSEFYDQASDHDAEVVRLTLNAPVVPSQVTYTFSGLMNGNTGAQNFSVTAKLTPGSDITTETKLRYRATLTRDGMPVSGLAVNYTPPGDSGTFTLDGSGTAFFGPAAGFRYGDVPDFTTTGATTSFTTTLTQPGTYTLTVQLVNIDAEPDANVGAPGSATFTLVSPDLSLTKSDGNVAFNVGGIGTYTITVTNSGTGPTTGDIVVTDTLPTGLAFAATGSGGSGFACTASGQTVTCTRLASAGALVSTAGSNGLALTLDVAVAAAAAPSVMNSATVTTDRDLNTANNTGTDTTSVVAPDLTVTKTHMGNFTAGQNGTYTITVENTGTGRNQAPITLVDTLPNSLMFVSGTGTNWTCMTAAGMPQTVNCTFSGQLFEMGSPAMTRTTTLTLVVAVGSGAIPTGMNTATVTNTATVSTANESNTANNTATDMTTIGSPVPTITAVSPNHGPTSGGTTVTITGTGFRPGATVTFDGVMATSVMVVNGTTITALSPAGTAGPKAIVVRNSDTQASSGAAFVYEQPNVMPVPPLTRAAATPLPTTGMPAPAPPMRAASTPGPAAPPPLPAPPRR